MLERAFPVIRAEVMALVDGQRDAFQTNFTPGGYRAGGWQTLNLSTDRLRYHSNRARLPVTTAICDSVGAVTVQVGILAAGSEIEAHHGDTNVAYRIHLGLDVPGGLPELGISVGGEVRTWVEGEALAFEDAHEHAVWNRTDRPRTVLVVDVLKEEAQPRARWVCARAGIGIVLQLAQAKVPGSRRAPRAVWQALQIAGAVPVLVGVEVQRRMGWRVGPDRRRRARSRAQPELDAMR